MADEMELNELEPTEPNPFGAARSAEEPQGHSARELEAVYDIPVTVSAVLGKATMQVSQLLKLGRGTASIAQRQIRVAMQVDWQQTWVQDRRIREFEVLRRLQQLGRACRILVFESRS